MRRLVLSLVVSFAAATAGYAQSQRNSSKPQGALGSPESAPGGLRGVYGPPESAAGHLRGVYAPPQSPQPKPLSSTPAGPNNSSTDNIPSVTLPGTAETGQSLPDGVNASPIADRPGYGRATVNGRPAIIEMGDNRIVEFSD